MLGWMREGENFTHFLCIHQLLSTTYALRRKKNIRSLHRTNSLLGVHAERIKMVANQAVNSEPSAIRQPHFVEHAEISAAKEWCGMLAREATSSLCAARFSELAKGADLRRERPQSYDRTDLARCRKRVATLRLCVWKQNFLILISRRRFVQHQLKILLPSGTYQRGINRGKLLIVGIF